MIYCEKGPKFKDCELKLKMQVFLVFFYYLLNFEKKSKQVVRFL